MPVFSVVVPCYRIGECRELVEQCIWSIANQTCSDFELILVDDGSPDGSAQILRELLAASPPLAGRARVVALPENGGVCVARNAGIDAAKGDYIAFLDYDDLWQPRYLEAVRAAVEANSASGAFLVRTEFLTQLGKEIRVRSSGSIGFLNGLESTEFAAWHLLHNFPVGMGSASVIQRALYSRHPQLRFDTMLSRTTGEDVLLGFQLLDLGIRPWYVDEPLCVARRVIGQLSRGTYAHLVLDERPVSDYIAQQATNSLVEKVTAARPAYATAFDAQRDRQHLEFALKREFRNARQAFGLRSCVMRPRGLRTLLRLHAERTLAAGPLEGLLRRYYFWKGGNDPDARERVQKLLANARMAEKSR